MALHPRACTIRCYVSEDAPLLQIFSGDRL